MWNRMKRLILENALFYLLALLTLYGLKYHYSRAGSEDLKWILAPTTAMVQGVSGMRFEHEAHTGYVNRERRVIIAPACAGVAAGGSRPPASGPSPGPPRAITRP